MPLTTRLVQPIAPRPLAHPGAVNVALLVAAGYGRRFDPTGARAKLEARIDGTMVAVHTARALLAHCDRVIACVRAASIQLADELAAVGCDIEQVQDEADEGMGHSIACGARRAAGIEGLRTLLVQPADMPWLATATVEAILSVPIERLTVLPTYRGQDGHPVRFGVELLPELAQLSGERGARPVLLRHPPLRIPVEDPGVVRDVDTPADLMPTRP
jgi:molybdenum cofactor cytidylyltransferase